MAVNRCIDMFSKSFYRSNANNNVFLFVRNIRWNTLTRNFSFSYQKYRDSKTEEENFEQIFRESQFVKLGRPRGKTVTGKVIHISGTENDDLYVDFGWKFYAVVKRPSSKKGLPYIDYHEVGSEIKLRLQDLEATGHFLGQSKRITMCEADAKLAKN